jgi:hypothetical protein
MDLAAIRRGLPGPAVAVANAWLALFLQTPLTDPTWEMAASHTSSAIGAFVSVVLSILLKDVSRERLKWLAWLGLVLTVAALWGCWHFSRELDAAIGDRNEIVRLGEYWKWTYIAAMVVLICTVTLAVMSLEQTKPRWVFWIAVAALIILVAAAIGLFIWWIGH